MWWLYIYFQKSNIMSKFMLILLSPLNKDYQFNFSCSRFHFIFFSSSLFQRVLVYLIYFCTEIIALKASIKLYKFYCTFFTRKNQKSIYLRFNMLFYKGDLICFYVYCPIDLKISFFFFFLN